MDMIRPEDLPEWTDDPLDRLRHTLAAFKNRSDDDWAVSATHNFIPGHPVTGLTWGDLWMILAELDEIEEYVDDLEGSG